MKEVKVKNLRVGDIFVGKDGVEYKIEEIKPFDKDEMYYFARNCETGISTLSSSSKEAKAKVVNR